MSKNIFLICLVLIISSCAKYKVVGKFNNFNEVFIGDIDHNLLAGRGAIEAVGQRSGIRCTGVSYVTYVPLHSALGLGCSGQRGKAPMNCTDGRKLDVDWVATSCTTGEGRGVSSDGAQFTFAFGFDDDDAYERLDELEKINSGKKALPVYRPGEVRKEKGFATGTGFAISNSGHIITNYHVIDGANSIKAINTFTKKEYAASILKKDPINDVALVKINEKTIGLPLNDSKNVKKGHDVLTLGYPLISIQGQEQKATFGRINSLSGIKDDVRMFQVDIPIQPGNSGGPMIDEQGQVIGVITATLNQIVTLRETGNLPQNVNFAIKSDYILPLLSNIETNKKLMKSASFADLIEDSEKSVYLIVTK